MLPSCYNTTVIKCLITFISLKFTYSLGTWSIIAQPIGLWAQINILTHPEQKDYQISEEYLGSNFQLQAVRLWNIDHFGT